jgi:uncharacterized membrane protein HdeD (DUF308 family)
MRDFEFYRFRPDPFMAFCAACAVLAAVRLRRAPLRYAFLSGMALGVAATFSLKMAPLCLLVPLLCIIESRRLKNWRPLSLVIPNGLGFLVGTLPMFCWLTFHGLLNAYLSISSHSLGLFITDASTAMQNAIVLLGLAVFGGFLAIRMQLDRPQTAWPSVYGVIAAALLALSIPMIEPNRLTYNLQAFLMPAAVLGTMLMASLLELDRWPWKLRLGMVAAVFAFAAIKPVLYSIEGTPTGVTIPMADLQKLIELRTSDDATCVGFAPWHPAFCRDATGLYVGWDLWIFSVAGMPPERTQAFRKMWSEAVSQMEQNRPGLIIDTKMWTQAHTKRIINDEEYQRFMQLTRTDYRAMPVGEMVVYVRKDLAATMRQGDVAP